MEGRRTRKDREQSNKNRKIVITVISILAVLLLIVVLVKAVNAVSGFLGFEDPTTVTVENDTNKAPKDDDIQVVTFKATGDNLIHNTIYEQAAARAGGDGYDFSYAYEEIEPIIADTDLVFVNQETPVATSVFEPSNYPLFNTPQESVTALQEVGFNLFNLASNHTLDKGIKGIEATLDFMDTVPNTTSFGVYRNYTDEHTPRLVEVNGVVFSFIGITEMTNGMSLPADTEIDIVYTDQTDKIQAMIAEAEARSDVVVLSVHWGDENVLKADQRQRDMATDYAEMGADLIIGHHPHVLQEIETITTSDNRSVPVVYSLGNFISAMSNKPNHIGGFFGCTITKNSGDGEIAIDDLTFIPVVNYFASGYGDMHVVPFADYSNELAASHGLGISRDYVTEILEQTVGTDILEDKATDNLSE